MPGFELFPSELTSDVPRITMTGDQLVQVEQHKGIVTYQDSIVAVQTSIGTMNIEGENLNIKRYTAFEIIISGCINKLYFETRRYR